MITARSKFILQVAPYGLFMGSAIQFFKLLLGKLTNKQNLCIQRIPVKETRHFRASKKQGFQGALAAREALTAHKIKLENGPFF